MIHGTTELVAIVGSPIAQVKSPQNFNSWFTRHGKDLSMIPIDLDQASLDQFVDTLRGWRNLRGCVVTVPYKHAMAAKMDALSARAQALQCVNVVRRQKDGSLVGDMVDGEGFISATRNHAFNVAGSRAAVIGGGGAGSAIAWALCEHGAAAVSVTDLDATRAQRLQALLIKHHRSVIVETGFSSLAPFDLIVNASPAGMVGYDALPLSQALIQTLRKDTFVADVVTSPEITSFLEVALRLGCTIQTGAEMALAQAGSLGAFMGVTPLEFELADGASAVATAA